MGGEAAAAPGHPRLLAEDAGHVAVPGADLQLTGHHGADARGGQTFHHRRQDVEGPHEAGAYRTCCYCCSVVLLLFLFTAWNCGLKESYVFPVNL